MSRNIRVGMIVNTQGLKGEVRVYPLTDYKERFEELEYVYLDDKTNEKLYIERVKYKNHLAILKFKGLNDINVVEKYKNLYIYIPEEELRELPDDTYYIIDLIGSKVFDSENNLLGELTDVIQNSAQDIYVIKLYNRAEGKDTLLIPAVKEFIMKVDLTNKTIRVKLIEGMLQ